MSYVSEVQADSPLNWWRLGEALGASSAVDIGSANKVGTYTNSPTLNKPGAVRDDPDKAMYLGPGATRYVNMATYTTVPSPVTIEAWVNANAANLSDAGIAGWFDNSGANANCYIYITSGGLQTRFVTGAGVNDTQWDSTGRFVAGIWHQLVGTYDGTDARLYFDGALVVGPITKAAAGGTANTTFKIGNYGSPSGSAVVAGIDEVSVYSAALSAARILAHYQAAINAAPRLGIGPFPKFLLRVA